MHWWIELREGLRIAWDATRANKMRAGLTTLGIVIGIVTVTLMGTAIQGLKRGFNQSISALGSDVLYLERRDWFINSHEEWIRQNRRREITWDQVRGLQRQITSARAIAPTVNTARPVKYKNRSSSSVMVIGTTDQALYTGGTTVARGRFLTAGEAEGGRPVCVLGAQTATNLFRGESPVGARVHVGGYPFEVVGVLEPQGEFLGAFSLDNQVIVPIGQFTSLFTQRPDYSIQIKARDMDSLEDTREEARGIMRKLRRLAPGQDDDFAINQQDQFIKTFDKITGTIATVGMFITGLSLFVGGIGIMNIMFVSVAERTKEIGVRKAIGAKRRAILVQFLLEAAMICLLGGLLGLAIAAPGTLLLRKVMPATISLSIVGLALLVALLTGVLAGFLPAWRAARMNPVDALRNE
ncbi:MAG TPA: ABC transporter permease [Verrucomicrobiota bacterium]|nr:ABC transporter permease [Verrucomicrobiota bacterium]HRZ36903.1 ABC transporter permease [Candidatus Paceibacterota bacterium]HRZ56146.1 ABC transporter permease [Candidatus Paceibacterota bacterium]